MNIPDWISAGCAILTIVGALIAWWRSNLSKHAREELEYARFADERTYKNAVRQREAVEKIARELKPALPGLELHLEWIERDAGIFILRNTGVVSVTINKIVNDLNNDFAVKFPIILDSGMGKMIYYEPSLASKTVSEIVLDIKGLDEPIVVPF